LRYSTKESHTAMTIALKKTFLALFQVPSRNFLLHTFFWHGLVIEHAEWGNYAITKLFLILLLGGLERKVKLQPHTKIN
jgi:hypothetical protein